MKQFTKSEKYDIVFFYSHGKSIREISEEFGTCHKGINKVLNELNIPIRYEFQINKLDDNQKKLLKSGRAQLLINHFHNYTLKYVKDLLQEIFPEDPSMDFLIDHKKKPVYINKYMDKYWKSSYTPSDKPIIKLANNDKISSKSKSAKSKGG